ncbi:hypothetical protein HWV03_14575 [Moritella sp. 36]|uniref:hypothetical protein n=1 Tax=Moritella sp. 36 TaxID=2746233 RepID=UPI001BA8AD8F|nr:hypothetical protein [Moritella sp. 36]QUM89942.1 hypothetical protein HWV03_14575 [Moritella sp. 36]
MTLWSDDDYENYNYILVPHHLKSEFSEAVKCGMFEKPLKEVWLLSSTAAELNDVELICRLLRKVFGYSSVDNKIDFVEKINTYVKGGHFNLIPEALKSIKKKSRIESKILDSLFELFYVNNFIKNTIVVGGPIGATNNWLDDDLLFSQTIVKEIDLSSYQHCHITSEIIKNSRELKKYIAIYKELNPYKKLAFLASYFLYCCIFYMNKSDYSHAIILLHRAVETIFISWLVQDQELHLSVLTGGKSKDKFVYILGYMERVLKNRSLTDDEQEAVKNLNILRNESKFAHGYKVISKESFDSIFSILKSVILSDILCQEHLVKWDAITQAPTDIYDLLYNYLTKNNYIIKYDC